MKVVITGASGQLGRELARQLGFAAVSLDRQSVIDDILDDLRAVFSAARDARLLHWRMGSE